MISRAVNSGALNAVGFPGSEEGASLVQLIGLVQVTCVLTTLSLHLTTGAVTAAGANVSSPTMLFRSQVSATTVPTASAQADSKNQARVYPSSQPAAAAASSGVLARMKNSASTTAVATAQLGATRSRVLRTAATVGSAASSASWNRRVSFGAATIASASASASNKTKVPSGATSPATAFLLADVAIKSRLYGTGACFGLGQVYARRNLPTAAGTTAASVSPVAAMKFRLTAGVTPTSGAANCANIDALLKSQYIYPSPIAAAANCPDIDALLRSQYVYPLLQTAAAACQNILIAVKNPTAVSASCAALGIVSTTSRYRLSASTTAAAVASSAATDYAVTIPAPDDRLMTVEPSERTMEVTI